MTSRSEWRRWLLWAAITALLTLALLPLRTHLEKTHIALTYLLLVLAGSARAGHRIGLALAAVSFLLFDWCFLPPYNTLAVNNPLDWYVLAAFLIVSVVAAQLLNRLRSEADAARRRAVEIDRFAALGADTLNVAFADQALVTIAAVIRSTLALQRCQVHPRTAPEMAADADQLVTWAAEHRAVVVRHADRTVHVTDAAELTDVPADAVRAIYLPLNVRDRTVGVLELESDAPMLTDASQRRFLAALAPYAAIAVERARLEAEAGHAEALREADRLKNALLASVSHDLRTPLTTIKALAHDLARADDRAIVIEEEADRLNRFVSDLLDLSRLQAGASPVAMELNSLDDLVGAAVQRVSGALGDRELAVDLEDGGTMLVGRFDFSSSLRILANLIENAHKYSPAGAPIGLTVVRDGARILVTVADQGRGVAESERERIFEPFYRPAGSPPDVGGAGLGLAIARRLAEGQGGTLTCAPRPGGGSVFTLTLPAADLPESSAGL
ncbi:MAG TPA: ATP-binding protein [Gemmatimonadales bacterium]|jgi:two-component system sensor histidine kinase KdpD|nr:ATP-binding protein [Gemmatimonadales bacterium]